MTSDGEKFFSSSFCVSQYWKPKRKKKYHRSSSDFCLLFRFLKANSKVKSQLLEKLNFEAGWALFQQIELSGLIAITFHHALFKNDSFCPKKRHWMTLRLETIDKQNNHDYLLYLCSCLRGKHQKCWSWAVRQNRLDDFPWVKILFISINDSPYF